MPPAAAIASVATVPSSRGLDMLPPAVPSPTVQAIIPVPPTTGYLPRGLILSPASDPIPSRLVQRIRSGEFVEMRDLLADNVALHTQLEDLHGVVSLATTPAALRPRLREVPNIQSWMYCFAAYVAVRSNDPTTRELLAYSRLVIREALRHGGSGWMEYDRSFRRQAAINPSMPWNTISPGLQAATLMGNGGNPSVFCTLCREPDHYARQCALATLQQQVSGLPRSYPPLLPHQATRQPHRPGAPRPICASWNDGACTFPGVCTFRHTCRSCGRDHMAINCPGGHTSSRSAHAWTRPPSGMPPRSAT